jgi:PTS system galactitol-specific IIA component
VIWNELNENCILTGITPQDTDGVFEELGGTLVNAGICKESYVDALKDREKDFPTGLAIGEFGVAIPHTDSMHVNRSAVAIATLSNPVIFYEMGAQNKAVPVEVVFMLAVSDPKEQIDTIQDVMAVFQDTAVLKRLMAAENAKEVIRIIREKEEMR